MSTPAAVHVWRDDPSDSGDGEWYSISTVDSYGDEIRYMGGDRSLTRAWAAGRELAARLSVPALQFADRSGQSTAEAS